MMGRVVAVVLVIVGWFGAVAVGVTMLDGPDQQLAAAPRPLEVRQEPPPTQGATTMRGCVIRFDRVDRAGRTAPRKHENGSHRCVGVNRVYADHESGDLVITGPAGGAIVFISISPDETMTEKGISCGASGGIGVTHVRCYDRSGVQVPADSDQLFDPTANLWVGWMMWAE